MAKGNLYYFVSDIHLGVGTADKRGLERRFLSFLNSLPQNTKCLYLLGDIFDFWYEYKYVIPSGHTRVLGKLAELVDSGLDIYFFNGNHDIWTYKYFQEEVGLKILEQPYVVELEGKTFCMGHGDGLGKVDLGFRFLRYIFHGRVTQILFSAIHPRWGMALGYNWSKHSRLAKTGEGKNYLFKGEGEPIYKFADKFGRDYFKSNGKMIDYYIFGHFHIPTTIDVASGGVMNILGEWINDCDFIVFDGETLKRDRIVEDNR